MSCAAAAAAATGEGTNRQWPLASRRDPPVHVFFVARAGGPHYKYAEPRTRRGAVPQAGGASVRPAAPLGSLTRRRRVDSRRRGRRRSRRRVACPWYRAPLSVVRAGRGVVPPPTRGEQRTRQRLGYREVYLGPRLGSGAPAARAYAPRGGISRALSAGLRSARRGAARQRREGPVHAPDRGSGVRGPLSRAGHELHAPVTHQTNTLPLRSQPLTATVACFFRSTLPLSLLTLIILPPHVPPRFCLHAIDSAVR
jgi:hypothetical protein